MSNAVATQPTPGDLMEQVIIKGDLSKLTPDERSKYYMKVCESVGLNPFTKPFEYITLNNKLQLYALKACTEQLRLIHKVSVVDMAESERDGVFIVTVKVQNADGRTDMAKGAVTITGLKGDALANAIMKAETKAKRRATLSIGGLGWLDESEIETIPGAKVTPQAPLPLTPAQVGNQNAQQSATAPRTEAARPAPAQTPANGESPAQVMDRARAAFRAIKVEVAGADSLRQVDEILSNRFDDTELILRMAPSAHKTLFEFIEKKRAELMPAKDTLAISAGDDFDRETGEVLA